MLTFNFDPLQYSVRKQNAENFWRFPQPLYDYLQENLLSNT